MSIIQSKFQSKNQNLDLKINFNSKSSKTIIFIPGMSGDALSNKYDSLAKKIENDGYNFVRFNFRAFDKNNPKKFQEFTLNDELEDLYNLINHLILMNLK